MKTIIVKLIDSEGYTITERECETKKEAKETAKYLLSDDYAIYSTETTHEKLGTDHAELWINDEHIDDFYRKEK
jgi:hypothetical protein